MKKKNIRLVLHGGNTIANHTMRLLVNYHTGLGGQTNTPAELIFKNHYDFVISRRRHCNAYRYVCWQINRVFFWAVGDVIYVIRRKIIVFFFCFSLPGRG